MDDRGEEEPQINADFTQIAMPRERGTAQDENGTRQRVDVVDDMDSVDSMDRTIFEKDRRPASAEEC